ncbi:hypothetical protein RRG08_050570 [Elysia crispata]|uniref:Uncharacterized protein n=1 Tax=Elysia crispata TaxID=231223 RepID=A0AAE1DB29_9GAST|nr:hypothetical protein RRG08_050570 [Elysia crispata]
MHSPQLHYTARQERFRLAASDGRASCSAGQGGARMPETRRGQPDKIGLSEQRETDMEKGRDGDRPGSGISTKLRTLRSQGSTTAGRRRSIISACL